MIKFNLKKTKITAVSAERRPESTVLEDTIGKTFQTQGVGDLLGQIDLSQIDSVLFVKFSIKIFLISLIPLGLKAYEIYNINLLENEKGAAEALLSSRAAESAGLQKQIDSFSYLKKQADEYEKKKTILKKLAADRLTIPKFLDQVQTKIPQSVWLKTVNVSSHKKNSKISIEGESLNEESVNNFLVYLKDVVQEHSIQFNTSDVKKKGRLVRVKFNIKADL